MAWRRWNDDFVSIAMRSWSSTMPRTRPDAEVTGKCLTPDRACPTEFTTRTLSGHRERGSRHHRGHGLVARQTLGHYPRTKIAVGHNPDRTTQVHDEGTRTIRGHQLSRLANRRRWWADGRGAANGVANGLAKIVPGCFARWTRTQVVAIFEDESRDVAQRSRARQYLRSGRRRNRYVSVSSAARASKPVGRPDNIDACPNISPISKRSSTCPSLTTSTEPVRITRRTRRDLHPGRR